VMEFKKTKIKRFNYLSGTKGGGVALSWGGKISLSRHNTKTAGTVGVTKPRKEGGIPTSENQGREKFLEGSDRGSFRKMAPK